MIIYKITNVANGKSYVGQTVSKLNVRWSQHVHAALKNKSNSVLGLAIRKYGRDSFKIEVLMSCLSIEELNKAEMKFIQELDTLSPNGYNLDSGGKNCRMHESTKTKLSSAKIGRKIGPFSQEHKDKISKALKLAGIVPPNTPEINLKKANVGVKNGMFGKKHSIESIAKMKAVKAARKK